MMRQIENVRAKKITVPFSLTGSPVIVIPIGRTAKGLPLGVQVVGRRMHEYDLLKHADMIANAI